MFDLIAIARCCYLGWRMGVVAEKEREMTEAAVKTFSKKPLELVKVEDEIATKRAKGIYMLSLNPVPEIELAELDDEVEQLEKKRRTLINEWQS